MKTWNERLRETRLEQMPKMSQAALARLSGVSQSTIANIEGGRNEGSTFILALAEALGVRAQWLKDGTGPKTDDSQHGLDAGPSELASEGIPVGLKKIQKAYKAGGPAKQEALVRLAELPEAEMATLLLVIQSIGSKYKR